MLGFNLSINEDDIFVSIRDHRGTINVVSEMKYLTRAAINPG